MPLVDGTVSLTNASGDPLSGSVSLPVTGSVAAAGQQLSGSTFSGYPVVVGGVYSGSQFAVAPFRTDAGGALFITTSGSMGLQVGNSASGPLFTTDVGGVKATYSAALTASVPATTATDVFTIAGSSTKTIKVNFIEVTGVQSTAGTVQVLLVKRSTADSAGTSGSVGAVAHDSTDPVATAAVLAYTANPTLGAFVGSIRSARVFFPAAATAVDNHGVRWDFGTRPGGKEVVLRGAAQQLAVNLGGVTLSSGLLNVNAEWTEE